MANPRAVPSVKFSNGFSMPMFGLGTYLSKGGEAGKAVKDAIDLGYRHIDTAFFYLNEEEIGEAVREKIEDGTVKREDLFITTKLWNNSHKEDAVVPACKKSLNNLGLEYIDLYLIHWPFASKDGDDPWPLDADGKMIGSEVDYLETWRGMEECVRQGLTRSIGVSNFNSEQIERLMQAAKIKPVNNQIECNVNVGQRKLIDFCAKHNITVTGYSPLGRPGNRYEVGNSLDNPKILQIAEKYKKTPAQIALRYVYQQGAAPVPKSVTKSRIEENMKIFDFSLTDEEMKTIESLGTGERVAAFAPEKKVRRKPHQLLRVMREENSTTKFPINSTLQFIIRIFENEFPRCLNPNFKSSSKLRDARDKFQSGFSLNCFAIGQYVASTSGNAENTVVKSRAIFIACDYSLVEPLSKCVSKMAIPNEVPSAKFSNGFSMPMFGLGTYLSRGEKARKAVKDAIDLGYRHIDTAFFYQNEAEIGEAVKEKIADGTVKREDLFITTKLWNNCHKEDAVVPACKKSLNNLGLEYIDLYLIHWPFACKDGDDPWPLDADGKMIGSEVDYLETWRGMEECVRQGLTRSIGVSNFNSEQIERLMQAAQIKPVNNQIECNVNVGQRKLIEFCAKRNITVTGYSPLGSPGHHYAASHSLANSAILKIAEKYKKTPAQIALRYVYQQGAAPVPKSVTKNRIEENIKIFDFSLSDDEMNTIESLGTGERVVELHSASHLKYYPFTIPF
ncbi:uncharacterized protein [Venturia canescens]|uniref:uncharacterized protein n=1 Tax=Venturia canescens TaxID=32260 RepID=UPI001C9C2854|nr:uncharacterized protein LOC122419286 [Venturia canescens]